MEGNVSKVWDWARLWTAHDVNGLINLFTPDGLYEDVALSHLSKGEAALREFFEQTFVAFPDFKVELQRGLADDRCGLGEWIMSGTHLGDFPGQPATGKPFEVPGMCVMLFENGRIAHHRDFWNQRTFK